MSTDLEVEPRPAATPIDPRFRARRIEVRRDAGRRRLNRLLVLAGVLAVPLVLLGLAFTPVADVDTIEVEGMFRTSPETIVEAAGVQRGDPTLFVDAGAAEEGIEALPWVADAEVHRSLPGTVRLVVEEREPVAVAATADERLVVVDGDGTVVEVHDGPASSTGLPVLAGVVGPLEVGASLDPSADVVVRVAAAVPGGLVASISEVRVGEDGAAELSLLPQGTARLGSDDELDDAFVALASVLGAVQATCVDVIDVAVPSAPVLTSVPGCQ